MFVGPRLTERFLVQVCALPGRLRRLWTGFPLHGATRLPAPHRRPWRPDTLHVRHRSPGHCRLHAAQMQGQTSDLHCSRLT